MDGEGQTCGGCEGPDAMCVKLIPSDGHESIVKRTCINIRNNKGHVEGSRSVCGE